MNPVHIALARQHLRRQRGADLGGQMRATVPPCGVCRDLEPPQSLRKNVSAWPRAGTEKKVAFGIEREAPLALYAGGTVEIQKHLIARCMGLPAA